MDNVPKVFRGDRVERFFVKGVLDALVNEPNDERLYHLRHLLSSAVFCIDTV